MTEPIIWVALGALAVQAALFYAKELHPVHFWVLTLFNWVVPVRTSLRDSRRLYWKRSDALFL